MPLKKYALISTCNLLLALFLTLNLSAQQTVTGKIISKADNQPVVGATVKVDGVNSATQTKPDGSFTVTSRKTIATLIISAVGFETVRVPVNGASELSTISLVVNVSSLNDIVVTGYTTQKKKDITGSVAIVDIADAKKIPATSSEQLLQGQASGVTVINSGAPGAASTVFIRGISNFGQTQPLYVVDGVQVSDMSVVNPNDIESISVLKDAGSAAIYGVSGGNGVVVITTKRGKQGRAVITYDGFYGTQRPLSGNVWHIMNPEQQSQIAFRANDVGTEVLYPGGAGVIPTYGYHGPAAVGTFGAAGVTSDPGILQYYNFDANNPQNDFLIQKFATGAGTDWFHTVFKAAPEQAHTVSASGGNDRSNYYFSANYTNQQGTLINNYEKRYAARMNTNFFVKNHIRVGENAFVTYRENNGGYNGNQQQEGGSIAYTFREMPIIPVYDVAGHFAGGFDGPGGEPLGNGSNPYAIVARSSTSKSHAFYVEGNVFGEVDFAKYFTFHTGIGGRLYNQYYWYISYNPYENYESHTNPNADLEDASISSTYNWTNTLTYKEIFGKHNIQVLAGAEYKGTSGRELQASAQGFFSLDPSYVQLQFGTPVNAPLTYIYQPTAKESYFGRLDYSYDDRYLLAATIRRDASSIFYPGHQVGYFPSVSLGWRLSQEEFMKSTTWLNNLKIRGSYGVLGNDQNAQVNNAYSTFASGTGISYYGINGGLSSIQQGFYNNQLGNQASSWEKDKILNIGLDVSVFNHLDFTVEWYKKSITGLLFQDQADAIGSGGANLPSVNIGDVENKGVDASATYHARVGRDFTFSIGVNITTYKNLITKIPGANDYFDFGYNRDLPIVRNQVGHPIGAFYGYKVVGIYQSNADAAKGPTYKGAGAGSFIYQNTNGDSVIDANDRTWIGNPNPTITYGINLNAGFKGFDFTMVFYGSQGNKDYNYVRYWTDFYSTFQGGKSLDMYNKAAIVQGGVVTNPGATLSAASFSQAMGSSTTSSYYIENGSFLKCRVAQLGYTISPSMLKRAGIDKLHIYVQATNLFTITKYKGPDPELIPSISNNGTGDRQSGAFGIDYGAYPNNQKQYIVGLNLTF
ncbi:MAG TPA: SusC/RagA family TonB-linked outer membrane protein [Puia sp.]|nr:SusC/RagA family TonB-linked outer membrane protein [Puia sp.]